MGTEILKPLGGHEVFLLLVQLAMLLLAARLCAEGAKRLGLPAVVGELSAGIALGPSVLGHFAPAAYGRIFPQVASQFQLLEVVGTLGMVLLLFLTGLETDLRLLRNLGRPAFFASLLGMVVPFASGYWLGGYMPDTYLANPERRELFRFFLATAMAISAMPVIAKILIDLGLTKRNIGVVILTAGVVDDTAGWLILSVIAGAASSGAVQFEGLWHTLLFTGGFLLAMAVVVYPLSRGLMWVATRWLRTSDAGVVLLLVMALLCAAATEYIGVHAVFGAFVCGTMFRQVPGLEAKVVHRLEDLVHIALAPVFFGLVGLKVDLWHIESGVMLALVLGVACLGKLIGCTLGSLLGGMKFWESLSVAVAMNARGAMELVVATIGLSLGILNPQMFSIIVVVAIATSLLAPLALRLTIRKVQITEEEARRVAADASGSWIDSEKVRILIPTAGGSNTTGCALLAAGLAARSEQRPVAIAIEERRNWSERLLDLFLRRKRQTRAADKSAILKQLTHAGLSPEFRQLARAAPGAAIVAEAHKGYDLIILGASHHGHILGGGTLEQVVTHAACHVIAVRTSSNVAPFRRLIVPFDGSVFARVAVEAAVRYAEATKADLTIAIPHERRLAEAPPEDAEFRTLGASEPAGSATEDERAALDRISRVFRSSTVRPQLLYLEDDLASGALQARLESGTYDLVMVGAENRATRHRLFFGYEIERLIGQDSVPVAVVIPNLARMN